MINEMSYQKYKGQWEKAEPFSHLVIKDFLQPDVAQAVVDEFPDFNSDIWRKYDNPIEVKKLCNHWDKFGPTTYTLFQYLNSSEFIAAIETLVGCELLPDFGLNGGGLHTHRSGGKLNTHLDYSLHPKLGLERRLNLLIYVTPNWNPVWGGSLGLWAQAKNEKAPGELVKTIAPEFNTAVLFDTTQDSWHGLPDPIACPESITRNSLAVYYLCEPGVKTEARGKALFAPNKDQENNPEILELIKKRSSVAGAADVYGDK